MLSEKLCLFKNPSPQIINWAIEAPHKRKKNDNSEWVLDGYGKDMEW